MFALSFFEPLKGEGRPLRVALHSQKQEVKNYFFFFLAAVFFLAAFLAGFLAFAFFFVAICFLPYVEVEHDQKNKSSSCLPNHNYILVRDSDECQSKFTTQGLR